jgi:hypothetical protein
VERIEISDELSAATCVEVSAPICLVPKLENWVVVSAARFPMTAPSSIDAEVYGVVVVSKRPIDVSRADLRSRQAGTGSGELVDRGRGERRDLRRGRGQPRGCEGRHLRRRQLR